MREINIADIVVSGRRREALGDLAGLARSMSEVGLLHPIVVDSDGRLVAGGRRMAAAEVLGWSSIAVTDAGSLTDAERDLIELEENLRRKDLTAYERSKAVVSAVEVAGKVEAETAGNPRSNSSGGRGKRG